MQSESASAQRGLHVWARVCLLNDSSMRGVIDSHVTGGYWTVCFADRSLNIHIKDLEVLPPDDPAFEPSQAPPSKIDIRAAAKRARLATAGRAFEAASQPASRRVRHSEASDDSGEENEYAHPPSKKASTAAASRQRKVVRRAPR
mmetsp:Transcript_32392/g.113985  ORF Transcript_32392/g.113985 Transcript_32392/m.113985 type:complete len:145 (+) Transcript_32392:60-494(+)